MSEKFKAPRGTFDVLPEGAGVRRRIHEASRKALESAGYGRMAQPVKLWTDGPFFRHERPQAGRYRQFTQIDAEAIGSDSPLVDAEMILLVHDLLAELGVEDVRLRLGSLG